VVASHLHYSLLQNEEIDFLEKQEALTALPELQAHPEPQALRVLQALQAFKGFQEFQVLVS
jgi:hypothetical protein